MSGNRANAAAIQRRTNAPQSQQGVRQQPPTPPTQQMRQQGQGQRIPTQGGVPQQFQKQQQNFNRPPPPKLSVSDAIGLVTLRLGRVESILQALPPLEHIVTSSSDQSENDIGENNRIVDEAVFTNITTRLQKIEDGDQGFIGTISDRFKSIEDSDIVTDSRLFNVEQQINLLQNTIESLTSELSSVKTLLETTQEVNSLLNTKIDDFMKTQSQSQLQVNTESSEEDLPSNDEEQHDD